MHLPFIVSISSVSSSKANCLQVMLTSICRPIYRILITMWFLLSPEFLTHEMILHSPSHQICERGCNLGRASIMMSGIRGSECGGAFSSGRGIRHWPTRRSSLCRSELVSRWPLCTWGLSIAVRLGCAMHVTRDYVFLCAQEWLCQPTWHPTLNITWKGGF